MVVDTKSFSELDFRSVLTLIESSNLRIDSELEVFNAAETWLIYNFEERSKSAKSLLQKVRLTLLSNQCLKNLLDNESTFSVRDECAEIINKVLENKTSQNISNLIQTSRCCNHNKYSMLMCGGVDTRNNHTVVNQVLAIDADDLNKTCNLPPMLQTRQDPYAVCIKGEIYTFGGYTPTRITADNFQYVPQFIEKYSPITKVWCRVTDMYDDRIGFCACSFMDKIFFIGGSKRNSLQLHTKNLKWKEISTTIRKRSRASCVVYEENIVVACGISGLDGSKTVESYDVASDTWTPMPSLVQGRDRPGLVVAKRKLFVIGGSPRTNMWDIVCCEVFDNVSNKFIALKTPIFNANKAFSIGNKIFVFENCKSYVICYDVKKYEWSIELSGSELSYFFDCAHVNLPLY